MRANQTVEPFQLGQEYKVHKSYIWAGSTLAVAAVLLVILLNGISGIIQLYFVLQEYGFGFEMLIGLVAAVVGVLVIWGIVVGIYALSWKNMYYVFEASEFSFYSGVFVKKRVHLPYDKVQSVNQRASIFQRLLGVCTVRIDSAGGSGNKSIRIPYVTLAAAEQIRHDLFARKAAVANGELTGIQGDMSSGIPAASGVPMTPGASVAPNTLNAPNVLDDTLGEVGQWRGLYGGANGAAMAEPVSFEYSLSNKELILASISHPGPLIAAFIIFITMIVLVIIAFTQTDMFATYLLAFATPITVGAVVISWLLGSLGILLSYGGFKVRRIGSRIEVESGLLTRGFSGIEIDRIQSIDVEQSILRRILKHSQVTVGRIDTAQQENKQSKQNLTKGLLIHPFIANSQLDKLLDGLFPEYADRPRKEDCSSLPRKAMGRNIRRRCLWFNWVLWVVLVLLGAWFGSLALLVMYLGGLEAVVVRVVMRMSVPPVLTVAAVLVVLSIVWYAIGAVLWAKNSYYGWNKRYLCIHNNGLGTKTSFIPRQKLQCGYLRDNPFQRRVQLTTLVANTAAGVSGGSTTSLIDIPAESGTAYLEWVS